MNTKEKQEEFVVCIRKLAVCRDKLKNVSRLHIAIELASRIDPRTIPDDVPWAAGRLLDLIYDNPEKRMSA